MLVRVCMVHSRTRTTTVACAFTRCNTIGLSVTQWVGGGGTTSAWRDALQLDLERDEMEGKGQENHGFSVTCFLDAL